MSWLSFQGRIPRKTFWLSYVLVYLIGVIAATAVDVALLGKGFEAGRTAEGFGYEFASGLGAVTAVVILLMIVCRCWPVR